MGLEYWKPIKEYYESGKNGSIPSEEAKKYAEEMEYGGATVVEQGDPWNPKEIEEWVDDSITYADDWEEYFPNLMDYSEYAWEIAAYFMDTQIEHFKKKIIDGDADYVDIAIKLDWMDMLAKNEELGVFIF